MVPRSAEIIRPILRGRDIKKYKAEFANLWLINTHNGVKEKNVSAIHIEDYPAIKKHLDKYYSKLEKRSDKGDTPFNLRNCAYMEDFFKHKIIYPNMTKFLPFIYDDSKTFLTNQKCFIVTGENIAYLTAFFNSSLFKFCFKDNFPELQGGTRELSKIFFDKIPVKKIIQKQDIFFKNLIAKIQKQQQQGEDTILLEQEVDTHIFNIYNLSKEEREKIGFITIR